MSSTPIPHATTGPWVRVCAWSLKRHSGLVASGDASLSPEEHQRAARFHFPADRQRFILGRAAMRHLGALVAGRLPSEVQFRAGPWGKPAFEGIAMEFNLSHSGDAVVLAWSADQPLGIDTEAHNATTSTRSFVDIARSTFSASELEACESARPSKLPEVFYRIWTRKEALLKAEGVGISTHLRAFSVLQCTRGHLEWAAQASLPGFNRVWAFSDLSLAECCALAAPPHCQVRFVVPEPLDWAQMPWLPHPMEGE